MKKLALLLMLLVPSFAWGAEYTCGTNGNNNSCTPAGLTTLIGNAVGGDTINIATGTHSWSSAVTLDKNLTISGGGSCPSCGVADPSGDWSWPTQLTIGSNGAFRIDSNDTTGLARISGLYINGHGPSHSYSGGVDNAIIVIRTGNNAPYRVDNIRFNVTGSGSFNAIRHNTATDGYGVWDHIYMYSDITGVTSDFASINGYNGDNGDGDWVRGVDFGSLNQVYVEDTTIYFETASPSSPSICFDQQGGGRTVVRHSYLRNCQSGNHGTESGWPARSGVSNEYYDNTFMWTYLADKLHTAFLWRGGSLYFHNNVVNNFQAAVKGSVYRVSNSYGCGTCGSSACADVDGFWGSPYPQGYPCIDQQGIGKSSSPGGLYSSQPQTPFMSAIWNNTLNNVTAPTNISQTYISEGQDYEYSADSSAQPSGYTPLEYPHPYVEGVTGSLAVYINTPTSSPTYVSGTSPITLAGTASAGEYAISRVQWANAEASTSDTATGTTTWTHNNVALVADTNTITVTVTDANADTATDQIIVYYDTDTTDPVVVVATNSGANFETTETTVTIEGTASDASGIDRVEWASNRGRSGTATGTTSWSFESALSTGDNVFTITAYDGSWAENEGQDTITVSTTTSTTDPEFVIAVPVNSDVYSTTVATIDVQGNAIDNSGLGISQVLWANSATGVDGTCTAGATYWEANSIALTVGENPITLTAYDTASPASTGSDTITITYTVGDVDDDPPVISISGPTSNPTYATDDTTVIVSGTAYDLGAGLDNIAYYNDLTATGGACIWDPAQELFYCINTTTGITLGEGDNVITITATDLSALANTASDVITITYPLSSGEPPQGNTFEGSCDIQ